MNLLLTLDAERARRARELGPRQHLHVRLDFHGVATRLDTNSSYLADHYRLGYGFFEAPPPPAGEPHLSQLALEAGGPRYRESFETLLPGREDREDNEHLLVPMQSELIYLIRGLPLLAYYAVNTLFGQVVSLLRDRFACLHAATVSRDGDGLMLCGAARCGKTVLTVLLLQQGLKFSSDDVSLLERDSLEVLPFPRALNIREEYAEIAAPVLESARRVRRYGVADQVRLLADLAQPAPDNVEPRIVCFPRYLPGRETNLQRVPPAEGLVTLMRHRFHPPPPQPREHDASDFEALSRLLGRADCFKLVFSDPVEASKLLGDLVPGERVNV